MSKGRHTLRNTMLTLTGSLLMIEAANQIIYRLAVKNPLPCEGGNFHPWKRGTFFYRKKDGPESSDEAPILLIHDLYPDRCLDDVEEVAEALARETDVYSMDLLGCGRSDRLKTTYIAYLYVLQIREMTEKIIGKPVHLVAFGRSADIAVAAAHCDPDNCTKITLVDPVFSGSVERDESKVSPLKRLLVMIPLFGTLIYHFAFPTSCAANTGGAAARYLFASIAGHYTDVNTEWMKAELDVPCRTVWTSSEDAKQENCPDPMPA